MKENLLALESAVLWLILLPSATSAQYAIYQNLGVNFSVVGRTNNQAQLLLNCEAGVNYVIESSPDLQNWTWVLGNSDSNVLRSFSVAAPNDTSFYRVGRPILPLFQAALAAYGNIDFKAGIVTADSFDSGDLNYSTGTNGVYVLQYDPAKDKANGDIITDSLVTNSLNIGNAVIKGTIRTGQTGSPSIGPNGSIGDLAWVNGGKLGIEAGHYNNDMNVNWPDVALPNVTWTVPAPANYWANGVYYKYYLTEGNYQISDFNGSVYVASGQVNIYIPRAGRISQTGGDQIYIAQPLQQCWFARLSLYVGVPSARLGGNGVINSTGSALGFIYFGLPTNTNFIFSANTNLTGSIYCPEAVLSLIGVSTNTYDFIGAYMANTVTLNGKFNFHFDENLERIGPGR